MGRSVFIEGTIENRILQLFGETKWASGVLIGQSAGQRDYVVHLALTPPQESEESLGVESQNGGAKKSEAEFDEEWFVQHCRQVNCMLTGGLRILGIFVFGSPDVRAKLQAKFRQTLYAVYKMLCSDVPLARWKLDAITSQVMLQVCSSTKKTTCCTIDVSDNKASIQPADLKYQNFVSKWIPLRFSLNLDLTFVLPEKTESKTPFSNLKNGLLPFLTSVANSLATVNGAVLDDEQQLIALEKQKKTTSERNLERKLDLYLTENEFEPDIRKYSGRQVLVVGTIESHAYLHPKATVKEAIDAIKSDVIRSLLTRCRLLCEDMEDDNSQDEPDDGKNEKFIKWELPRRIFAPICRGHVYISDCVFKDEETKDVLNRILELLGISLSEEDLISDEQFAENVLYDEIIRDTSSNDNKTNIETISENGSKLHPLLGASVGAITILLAAIVKWYYDE